LVAERLARSSWHDYERISTTEYIFNYDFLVASKVAITKYFLEFCSYFIFLFCHNHIPK
jgi:hypothetical protein